MFFFRGGMDDDDYDYISENIVQPKVRVNFRQFRDHMYKPDFTAGRACYTLITIVSVIPNLLYISISCVTNFSGSYFLRLLMLCKASMDIAVHNFR